VQLGTQQLACRGEQSCLINPCMDTTHPEIKIQRVDHELRGYDVKRKVAMKRHADKRSNAQQEHDIDVGDHVLDRMKPMNKLSPACNADPYKVTAVKRSML
jgi:hypothetical protein